ncbi:MAG TPA: hypothetical protein PKK94_03975 [Leptospiraceae bacterium]|nr:hypothetical protein [Leptospiraceae bacterium]
MKRIFAVLLFLTALNFVFPQSEESQEEQNLKEFEEFKRMREKEKKTEAEKRAKDREDNHDSGLFISFGGGTGNILSSGFQRKKMEQAGFSIHYLQKNSHLGFRISIGGWNYGMVHSVPPSEYVSFWTLYSGRDIPGMLSLSNSDRYPFRKEISGFSTYGADLGMEFHLAPSALFDPYLLGSVGGGLCGSSCSSYRAQFGAGAKITLGERFLFFESVYEKPFFFTAGDQYYPSVESILFRFGFGLSGNAFK